MKAKFARSTFNYGWGTLVSEFQNGKCLTASMIGYTFLMGRQCKPLLRCLTRGQTMPGVSQG